MNFRLVVVACLLGFPLCSWSQAEQEQPARENTALPEEVVIIGERSKLQLRMQLWESEVEAYEIFNKYNDEERFNIYCSLYEPTGTRIKTQVCSPEFQLQASRDHAQDYINGTFQHMPREMVIASQLQEYRDKIKQIAQEHPEFLEAVIRYTEVRERFENANRTLLSAE